MSERAMEVVLANYIDAIRRQDIEAVKERMDPDVVHRGVADHLLCSDRDEVLDNVRHRMDRRDAGITRLELTDAGDKALLYVEGPEFREIGGEALDGNLSVVFTVRDGKIVEMQDYRSRQEALSSVGISS